MWCRGIRGAITVSENTEEAIIATTKELLQRMIKVNEVKISDIACILFTTTSDLNAAFPAAAARRLGWTQVPLLCGHEMNVPGSLARCLRVLVLFNTDKRNEEIVHVYLGGAETLRDEGERTWQDEGKK
ncbi:MAG: chorismate mutase [Chloroflexi bacterium RBG_19FT_COMBO_48_23]|nr:MAG: chorismate mutase [Chloroflexi bacterium RBG_19FT_COMBO_48_23]